MAMSTKRAVLSSYKALHRTILFVFDGDVGTIQSARAKAREEFKKNACVKDPDKIEELLKFAGDVRDVLRKDVVHAIINEKGHYELQLRPEHLKDNAACAKEEPPRKQ
ncbi:complex III assembly factor LYRM7-like [Ornithodoros turicata]|uniref:complex III assembly factor LYRM7-like n=1 Tax=Ornithodoros turicata TaxID=34597 RepID=UPI0031399DE2